jgi:hypothetical protein
MVPRDRSNAGAGGCGSGAVVGGSSIGGYAARSISSGDSPSYDDWNGSLEKGPSASGSASSVAARLLPEASRTSKASSEVARGAGSTEGIATDETETGGFAADSGATDVGATDVGATDGGATDGGAADSVAAECGGAADCGGIDDGVTDGGVTGGSPTECETGGATRNQASDGVEPDR